MTKPEKNGEKKKESGAGGGLYIALAICILSVICVGVYSAIINIVGDTFAPAEETDPVGVTRKDPAPASQTPVQNDPVSSVPDPVVTEDRPVSAEPVDPETNGESDRKTPDEPAGVPVVTSFTRPVGATLCKPFSEEELLYSVTMNDYRAHLGADYKAGVGDAVHSFAAGTVEKVYEDPLLGQSVLIDHGSGLKSLYQNLSPTLASGIEEGKPVSEGQILGGVGETGLIECEDESHLHFVVTVDGVPVDPESYFR